MFCFQGFIMTLVSSLSHNPSWSLAAKINDGTMSLDVDISDKVHITTAIIWYSKELPRLNILQGVIAFH